MFNFTEFMNEYLPDILGMIGVFLVLWYYCLLQIGKCSAKSLGFSIANLVGSLLILFSLWFNWNLAAVIMEIAWILTSFYGIVNYFRPSIPEISEEPEQQF